jgi:hypothetical protein
VRFRRFTIIPKSKINGEGLAVRRDSTPLAVKEFGKWLEEARPACESAKMNILVLFDLGEITMDYGCYF